MPSPHNWRTTDEDEINRRRARARTEEFRISNTDPRHPIFSNFRVCSGSGLTYSVEIRDVRRRQFACDCVDFRINGLGTCKHVEAVLLQLQARFKRLFLAAEANGTPRLDLLPDPASDSIRLLNANGRLSAGLRAWFDANGALCKGLPEETIESLKQLAAEPRFVGHSQRLARASHALSPMLNPPGSRNVGGLLSDQAPIAVRPVAVHLQE